MVDASKASLNVSRTPQLTAYVANLVATGQYRGASEVMRAGLRLLQREDAASGRSLPGKRDPTSGGPRPHD